MNREYAIALQYVRQHYGSLYQLAEAVVLTPARLFPAGQRGQCSGDRYVNISDGLKTVGEYVDVLVHELTHCLQLAEQRETEEEEAYEAGIHAAKAYNINAAPWRKQ